METALIGFVAGLVGAAALNVVLSPLWDLSGLRNRIYVDLLLCAGIRPETRESLDLGYNARKLQVSAAELQVFDQSASRLTRALVAWRGYDLSTAVEALIGLSDCLSEGVEEAGIYLARTREALQIPEIGFPAAGSPDNHAEYRIPVSRDITALG